MDLFELRFRLNAMCRSLGSMAIASAEEAKVLADEGDRLAAQELIGEARGLIQAAKAARDLAKLVSAAVGR